MKFNFILLVFCTFFVIACKKDKPAPQVNEPVIETPAPSFTTTIDSLIKRGGGPCTTGSDCMEVKVVWPTVKGGNKTIRKILNDSIHQFVINGLELEKDEDFSNFEKAAEKLLGFYKEEYDENKAFGLGWTIEVYSEIDFQEDLAVIQMHNYSFLGGAHPNYYSHYSNFDTRTGKIIEYSDFVKDTTAFKSLVEAKFLKELTELTGEKVDVNDFFWENGFQLPKNYILGPEQLEMIYNPYEAAAYAYGTISIDIPYSELEGIIER